MKAQSNDPVNTLYVTSVTVFTFVLPLVGAGAEWIKTQSSFTFELLGKWFLFSAVGIRLAAAGIKQAANPAFTAKEIFHLEGKESYPILRELGFANLCFGLIGIVSLFMPPWRSVSAFGSGLYFAIAGIQHLVKKPVGRNETFALVTDLIIAIFLIFYFVFDLR